MAGIRPPRLEDAGLEDCALPPEAIELAFLKAAKAIGSVLPINHQLDGDDYSGKCVDDPTPSIGELPESLPGVPDLEEHPFSGKDFGIPDEALGDDVVVVGGREEAASDTDRLIGVALPSGGRACVAGLEDDVDAFFGGGNGEEEEDKRDGMPILAEACI